MWLLLLKRTWAANRHRRGVKVGVAVTTALCLNLCFGTAFFLVERQAQPSISLGDSIWWAMVTMTTVGYGDFFPKTPSGRFLVAYPCLIIGIGLIGYLLGLIADNILDHLACKKKGNATVKATDHLVICHCPSIPRVLQLAKEFRLCRNRDDLPVVVISPNFEEIPPEFTAARLLFVKGHPTSEETLRQAGVADAAGVIILAANPRDTNADAETFTTATLAKLIEEDARRPIQVVAEITRRSNLRMMEKSGADGFVPTEGITDQLLVQELFNPGLRQWFEQLVTYKTGDEFYVVNHQLSGIPLHEIQTAAILHPARIQVLGLMRNQQSLTSPPIPTPILASDQLIVLAENRATFETFQQTVLKSEIAVRCRS